MIAIATAVPADQPADQPQPPALLRLLVPVPVGRARPAGPARYLPGVVAEEQHLRPVAPGPRRAAGPRRPAVAYARRTRRRPAVGRLHRRRPDRPGRGNRRLVDGRLHRPLVRGRLHGRLVRSRLHRIVRQRRLRLRPRPLRRLGVGQQVPAGPVGPRPVPDHPIPSRPARPRPSPLLHPMRLPDSRLRHLRLHGSRLHRRRLRAPRARRCRLSSAATPGCVWCVHVDPSHQRSRSGAP